MPILQAASFRIDLKTAKAQGLADLGVPLNNDTEVKKGKLSEAMQLMDGDKIGRRFQNLRAILVKASEGGVMDARLILSVELFGDDNAPLAQPAAIRAHLLAGSQVLNELTLGTPFMPYASCWYENRFAAQIPLDAYPLADAVQLLVGEEDVRVI